MFTKEKNVPANKNPKNQLDDRTENSQNSCKILETINETLVFNINQFQTAKIMLNKITNEKNSFATNVS